MAESESQEENCDNSRNPVVSFIPHMEELLETMRKLTVRATQMIHGYIGIKNNPDLHNAMQNLEDIFLMCKELMDKKWQEVLVESTGFSSLLPDDYERKVGDRQQCLFLEKDIQQAPQSLQQSPDSPDWDAFISCHRGAAVTFQNKRSNSPI